MYDTSAFTDGETKSFTVKTYRTVASVAYYKHNDDRVSVTVDAVGHAREAVGVAQMRALPAKDVRELAGGLSKHDSPRRQNV